MSWLHKLYKTYDQCAKAQQFASNPPLPISHTTQQAHIEIVLDGQGNFRRGRAKVINREDQTTLIPCTEESGGRSGKAPKNHPLCDKLQYLAGDFRDFGGEVTIGFSKNVDAPYQTYLQELQKWASVPPLNPKLSAILNYVRKKQVIRDLKADGILPFDLTGKLLKKWDGEKKDTPAIFKIMPPNSSPEDAFIRWRIEIPGNPQSAVWEDSAVMDSWISHYASQQSKHGLCMVTGELIMLAEQHPAKLRNARDKAKLISSNDISGYTFRGRFVDADQACGVGFVVTQKAHKALQWLLDFDRKQAFHNESQVVVAWAVSGKSLPDPFANSDQLFGIASAQENFSETYHGDAGQAFARRMDRLMAGYRAQLGATDEIAVIALDSATGMQGRMAIVFYSELSGSEFLNRVLAWHITFSWHQNFGRDPITKKLIRFVGAPSPKDIAEAAYGRQVEGKGGNKLRRATVEKLLPCIIEGRSMPRDVVESVVRRTCNRTAFKKDKKGIEWEWEKNLGIACALFKGHHNEEEYQMTLEYERKSRDYLYGRLLAVADGIEGRALYLADENRDTNAARLMQRFADRPYSTWRTIELSLNPYMNRLRSKSPAFLYEKNKLLDELVCDLGENFTNDKPLSGEFLLGFHCQRQALRRPPKYKLEAAYETIDNQTNQGA